MNLGVFKHGREDLQRDMDARTLPSHNVPVRLAFEKRANFVYLLLSRRAVVKEVGQLGVVRLGIVGRGVLW
jgi:hypothetical protein